jgi:hypothetical protein
MTFALVSSLSMFRLCSNHYDVPSAHSFLGSNLQAQISDGEDLHPAGHDIVVIFCWPWAFGRTEADPIYVQNALTWFWHFKRFSPYIEKRGCFHKIDDFVVQFLIWYNHFSFLCESYKARHCWALSDFIKLAYSDKLCISKVRIIPLIFFLTNVPLL